MLKALWWRILGLVLVLFSLIAGVTIPLGPGIYTVDPYELKPDTFNEVKIRLINTAYKTPPIGWIKNGENTFCLENVKVEREDLLSATIDTRGIDNKKDLNLFLHDTSGTIASEKAFGVPGDTTAEGATCTNATTYRKPSGMYFPFQSLLYDSIRNLIFHVPMWFAMILVLLVSCGYSIAYLKTGNPDYDKRANALVIMGTAFGALGVFTGMVWAHNTWGTFWTKDPKLNGAAIGLLIYLSYLILRAAIEDEGKRAKTAAVANIYFLPTFIILIFVLPRITDSLHPGNGGNPGFNSYDLDNNMRMIFYPAVIGWMLIGMWIASIIYRIKRLEQTEE